jgi:hypothetical protein
MWIRCEHPLGEEDARGSTCRHREVERRREGQPIEPAFRPQVETTCQLHSAFASRTPLNLGGDRQPNTAIYHICSPECQRTPGPKRMWPGVVAKGRTPLRSCAVPNAPSHAKRSNTCLERHEYPGGNLIQYPADAPSRCCRHNDLSTPTHQIPVRRDPIRTCPPQGVAPPSPVDQTTRSLTHENQCGPPSFARRLVDVCRSGRCGGV